MKCIAGTPLWFYALMIKKTQTYHRTNRRKLIVTPCNWRSEGANHP